MNTTHPTRISPLTAGRTRSLRQRVLRALAGARHGLNLSEAQHELQEPDIAGLRRELHGAVKRGLAARDHRLRYTLTPAGREVDAANTAQLSLEEVLHA